MTNRYSVTVTCPYCGFKNETYLEDRAYPQLIICDVDEGGCDETFAIKLVNVNVQIVEFRLEEVTQ